MGMGDQKPKYTPAHGTAYDPVHRVRFASCLMRQCPHDGVQKKYGVGCYIAVYTCKRCQHGVRHPLFDGWTCALSAAETK